MFLTGLTALYEAGWLRFFGSDASLADRRAFVRHLAPVRRKRWVVDAKPLSAGPAAVLAYLARYTHRIAIGNSRLVTFDEARVTFRSKDYHRTGAARYGTTTLGAHEFIRRFLLHVLPKGFHRIRHDGLFASAGRRANLARIRDLLVAPAPTPRPRPCCRRTRGRPAPAAADA